VLEVCKNFFSTDFSFEIGKKVKQFFLQFSFKTLSGNEPFLYLALALWIQNPKKQKKSTTDIKIC